MPNLLLSHHRGAVVFKTWRPSLGIFVGLLLSLATLPRFCPANPTDDDVVVVVVVVRTKVRNVIFVDAASSSSSSSRAKRSSSSSSSSDDDDYDFLNGIPRDISDVSKTTRPNDEIGVWSLDDAFFLSFFPEARQHQNGKTRRLSLARARVLLRRFAEEALVVVVVGGVVGRCV